MLAEPLTVTNVSKDVGPDSQLRTAAFLPRHRGQRVRHGGECHPGQLPAKFLEETYRNMGDDTVQLISEARDVLRNDLEKKELAYRQFRERSPMIWKGKEEGNPRAGAADEHRIAAVRVAAPAGGHRGAVADDRAGAAGRPHGRGAGRPGVPIWRASRQDGDADRNPALTLKSQLLPLLLEERALREELGPNHPLVVSARERIEAVRDFFAVPSTAHGRMAARDRTGRAMHRSGGSGGRCTSTACGRKSAGSSPRTRSWVHCSNASKRRLGNWPVTRFKTRNSATASRGRRTCTTASSSNCRASSLVKDYGSFDARIIAPAGIGKQVAPNALLVFAAAGFLGVLGGLGLASLAERRGPAVPYAGGGPPRFGAADPGPHPARGREPDREPAGRGQGLDPRAVRPSPSAIGRGADAVPPCATRDLRQSRPRASRCIQITSPGAGEGKSTVAANLAVCPRASREADAVDRRRFPASAAARAVRHLRRSAAWPPCWPNRAEVAEAIQGSRGPQSLDSALRASGPRPPRSYSPRRFRELLDLVRDQYDCVLVDTPSVLEVPDPSLVAPCVDGVLLTVRISKRGRARAERARESPGVVGRPLAGGRGQRRRGRRSRWLRIPVSDPDAIRRAAPPTAPSHCPGTLMTRDEDPIDTHRRTQQNVPRAAGSSAPRRAYRASTAGRPRPMAARPACWLPGPRRVLAYRVWLLALAHAGVFAGTLWAAFLLRFDFQLPDEALAILWRSLPWVLGVKLGIFYALGQLHGWWRYVTFSDLVALLRAATLSQLVIISIDHYVLPLPCAAHRADVGLRLDDLGPGRAAFQLAVPAGALLAEPEAG